MLFWNVRMKFLGDYFETRQHAFKNNNTYNNAGFLKKPLLFTHH